jgi:diguanylate cyclase (GGDEF)-like protein
MLIASNARLRHEAQKMALFDPLTNLPNRRYLLDCLADTERQTVEAGLRFGIIYLDLDGFKAINDTLGHAMGDDLLRKASAAMSGALRAGDCLARIGGDEFVVVAEHVQTRSDLLVLAERLKRAVEAQPVPVDFPFRMRISCGCAIFPDDGNTAERVMREADEAMYRDKRRSRSSARIAVAV